MQGNVVKRTSETVNIHFKPEDKPFYVKYYSIPSAWIYTLNKKVFRLEDLGVINRCETDSEMGDPFFIIPNKMGKLYSPLNSDILIKGFKGSLSLCQTFNSPWIALEV